MTNGLTPAANLQLIRSSEVGRIDKIEVAQRTLLLGYNVPPMKDQQGASADIAQEPEHTSNLLFPAHVNMNSEPR
jgi:hypothetical protein